MFITNRLLQLRNKERRKFCVVVIIRGLSLSKIFFSEHKFLAT